METTPTVGIGFKPQHFEQAMDSHALGLWFEVHAETYLAAGFTQLAMLDALRCQHPLSIHDIGLSLAGPESPDLAHLAAIRRLCDRFDPFRVSEHLAGSRLGQTGLPDLLPFPRNNHLLRQIVRNIDKTQSELGREILIENPSHDMPLAGHDWAETEFLAEIARRTGCRLLLDLSNVHVSAMNLGFRALDYVDAFPAEAVAEIHLAGCFADERRGIVIDSHGSPVPAPVLGLLDHFTERHGPRPVLIEWDNNIPEFCVLMRERDTAIVMMAAEEGVCTCLN